MAADMMRGQDSTGHGGDVPDAECSIERKRRFVVVGRRDLGLLLSFQGRFYSSFEFEILDAAVTQPLPNVPQSIQIVAWHGSFPTLIMPSGRAFYRFQALSNRAAAIEIDNNGVFVVIRPDIQTYHLTKSYSVFTWLVFGRVGLILGFDLINRLY